MEIKTILKNARISRDLTLKQVQKETGIAFSTISSWERGACCPRGKNRDIIAAFFKLPPESLDYALHNNDNGSREFNVVQIKQDLAMTDYETKPIALHKKVWEMAKKVQDQSGDLDYTELFTRLIKASAKE